MHMKRLIRNTIMAGAALVCTTALALAQESITIAQLKNLCKEGESMKIAEKCIIEGIVVSDYRSPNMELNPNTDYATVNTSVNDATVYLQQSDSKAGIRLVFDEAGENRLKRFDHVSIDLAGCTVSHESNPSAVTVKGLTYMNVLSVKEGVRSDIAVKEKYISELTDEDMYTFVSLRNVEFIFKEGGYTDIYESYVQPLESIQHDYYSPSGRMDGWATLLRGSEGSCIYMFVNTLCPWRRDKVKRGTGTVSGIVVHTPMRRYGSDMGRYCIRPIDDKDLSFTGKGKSPWKMLAGWILNGENGQRLTFETAGELDGCWKKGTKGDRVLSDTGAKAFLWTDSDSFIHIDSDLNNTDVKDKGFVHNGALLFRGPTKGWYEFKSSKKVACAKSFLIEFSAKKAKASQMMLSFSWSAGSQKMDEDWGFPANWNVLCSINGGEWIKLRETATGNTMISLRPQPHWDGKSKLANNGHHYNTGFDCGIGNQHRSFSLPAEAIGANNVKLRITPANNIMYSIRKHPEAQSECNVKINPSFEGSTVIRFGEIKIEYN